jgi:subtilisin family serine protease
LRSFTLVSIALTAVITLSGCVTASQTVNPNPTPSSPSSSPTSTSPAKGDIARSSTPEIPETQSGDISGLIVRYEEGINPIDADGKVHGSSSVTGALLKPGRDIGFGFVTVLFSTSISEQEAQIIADQLSADKDVVSVELDRSVSLQASEDPEQIAQDLAQNNTNAQSLQATQTPGRWGLDRIDQRLLPLNGAYEYDTAGAGVRVYVVDTGVASANSEIAGRVTNGINVTGDANGTEDCNGHGTHVSGTIAGSTYGVAKAAVIVPVRVLNCAGQEARTSAIIEGLSWVALDHQPGQPAVVNMSLVMNGSDSIDFATRQVIADGVVVVAASGNSGDSLSGSGNACLYSPARVPEVITVNASTSVDDDASFSNYGTCTDLYAPGVGIVSGWIGSPSAINTRSGTSMASPHVAGAVARILSMNPALTPAQVQEFIRSTATTVNFGTSHLGDPQLLLFIDPFASNSNFVRNLYQDFFSRTASQPEVDYWSRELDSGRITPSQLTTTLSLSDEWIRVIIRNFYLDTLGREPDVAGYQYWIEQARAGKPIAEIGSFFYGSDEYLIVFGNNDQETWLRDLYVKLMLRSADPGGLNYWYSQVSTRTMSRPEIAHWFYQSPEKLGLRVDSLYTKLLARSSDPGGRVYWANRLKSEGDLVLASQLSSSPEYFNRRFVQ